MKRDFSNSKRKKLKEILEKNKNYFNSGNVSGEVLFSCQEASGEDYSQYYDEVENCVTGANSTYQYSDGQVDELIQEIDTVFDAAQKKDEEYVDVLEGNITLTTDNFITDLKALELALDVSGANEVSADNLETLGAGNMGSIFGNTKEFKEQLKDVDNPLYEEFLARFVTSSGVEYDEISRFAEENEDKLSAWELQVFETILNSHIDPDTGEVDTEGLERFLEAFYYYVPYEGSEYQEYYVYQLHDEYAQIYEYHTLHTDVTNDVALDENIQNSTTNNSNNSMNELLKKVYTYGQEILIPMYPKDEEHGGWCSTPVPNEVDLDMIDVGEVVDNVLPNVENATINPKKITGYALNPNHPVGKHKAKVFESALGYNQSNADNLIGQIYEKLPSSEAVLGELDEYGQRYTVDIPITGPNGNTVNVTTGWIIRTGSDIPELVTLYVND